MVSLLLIPTGKAPRPAKQTAKGPIHNKEKSSEKDAGSDDETDAATKSAVQAKSKSIVQAVAAATKSVANETELRNVIDEEFRK